MIDRPRWTAHVCAECGARYSGDDSCRLRFDQLLALDHSRQEPWGSRHGQAFSAFALQHPERHGPSLDAAWAMLYRIYRLGETPADVIADFRQQKGKPVTSSAVPSRAGTRARAPEVTIADLGDFDSDGYPGRLDDWCRSALASWGG